MATSDDIYARLSRQALGRSLDAGEEVLADALEAVFRTGCHDFERVATELQARGVPRPSGESGGWTPAVLEAELARINRSLDEAYVKRGSVERA